MKLGKRILALLACVLLCFAPAVLMVGAAELNDVCSHATDSSLTPIVRGTLVDSYRVATERKCYAYVYENSTYECLACGHIWIGTYVYYTSHRMVNNPEYSQ